MAETIGQEKKYSIEIEVRVCVGDGYAWETIEVSAKSFQSLNALRIDSNNIAYIISNLISEAKRKSSE